MLSYLIEILQSVISAFNLKLKEAGLDTYQHWLQPMLISQLQKRNMQELEAAALLDEVRLGGYEQCEWEETLDGINPHNGEREKIEQLLKEFYTVCNNLTSPSIEKIQLTRKHSKTL